MRVRAIDPEAERKNRQLLAIKQGDEVIYEGAEYIVTQVGSKFIHMYRKSDPYRRDAIAFKRAVVKAIPLPKEASDGLPGFPQK